MAHRINPNLRYLCAELKPKRRDELLKRYESKELSYDQFKAICSDEGILSGVVLEGSSRSFKTISSIDFIIYICSKVETGSVINIMRETYTSFKTTIYNDVDWRFPQFGIKSPFLGKQEVKTFNLFGNKITLIGADSESAQLGVGCDYLYMNEALEISKQVRDQAIQRCRKFWWMDLNPKYPDHDIFISTIPRIDVGHLRTTYKDNPQIAPGERTQIESYQPVELSAMAIFFGSKSEDEATKYNAIQRALKYDTKLNKDRFPAADCEELARCQSNEGVGTANKYMWSVYGLGERMAPEGLIFPHVVWVKEFPKNIEKIGYGMDFGYTESPSTLVKWGLIGTQLYAQVLFYQPTPSINELIPLLEKFITKTDIVWADPSGENGGRGMISGCRIKGYQVYSANTFPGSIKYGISVLKKYTLHLIDGPEWRKEQMGYTKAKAKVNGVMVTLDDPIDANNHAIDALRISAMSNRL